MQKLFSVEELNFIKKLGQGNFGEVYLTQINNKPGFYAAKKMDRKKCERSPLLERLSNEIHILQIVNHPNIVKYECLKRTQNSWYLVTEFVNGDSLTNNLKKYMSVYHKPFPEDVVQHLMKQIVSAIQYLHFNKIIHRDLKLDNILVNYPTDYDKQSLNLKSAQVKIIDFGFATILNKPLTTTLLGTPPNMDPQILRQFSMGKKTGGYNEKVDIWSLGTLCYEMVVGYSPFKGYNMQDLYQNVKKGNYTLPSTLSEEIVTFINGMLQQDTNQRLDANQLKNHKFLTNPVNLFHRVDVKSIKASFIPGGMLKMKSNQPQETNNMNNPYNDFNLWGIFTQPETYYGAQNQIYQQPQSKFQAQPQPNMQMPNYQPQPQQNVPKQNYQEYPTQQYQQNNYYNQPQNNYGQYY